MTDIQNYPKDVSYWSHDCTLLFAGNVPLEPTHTMSKPDVKTALCCIFATSLMHSSAFQFFFLGGGVIMQVA